MATVTDSIGRVLAGRYRIEGVLGTGGSAHVFLARDTTLRRRVAIKVLHPALATDAAFLRRFRAEAQAAAALTHPNVLSVYDWGDDGGEPFLVLEYLAGGSLRDLLDRGRLLSVAQAVSVGLQAAQGLAYAHSRGFVHRDIKPANLLFDEEGRLSIADFGLARALSEAAWTEPVGATVGTARYASPEQAGGGGVDGRGDIYSLALVLYESVTGVVPFGSDTTVGTLMARVGSRLPGDERLGPLAGVLAAAAAPDAAERLDAGSLIAHLRLLAGRLPGPEALPLAGAGGHGVGGLVGGGADATEHGVGTTSTSGGGASPGPLQPGAPGGHPSVDDGDVLAVATAVGVATPLGVPAPSDAPASTRRRRWPWITAVVVALLLVAGGLAVAAVRTKFFVPSHRVASLSGLTVAGARAQVQRDHFVVHVAGQQHSLTVPSGRIVDQRPSAGTSLKQGAIVRVVVSSGPPPVPVPDLATVMSNCGGAAAALHAAHLRLGACTNRSSTTVRAGRVLDWSPTGDAPEGSSVDVVVSSGPPLVAIPSLVGIPTCQGVTNALQAVGLHAACSLEYSPTITAGDIVSLTPTSSDVPVGSTVTIVLSKGQPPVTIPASLIGESLQAALNTLQNLGLVAGTIYGPGHGDVFATTPGIGTSVPSGSTVDLYVQ